MPTWLTSAGLKLVAFGAMLLGILLAVLRIMGVARKAGEAEVQVEDAKQTEKAVTEHVRVSQEVAAKPAGAAEKELQDQWSRPE